MPISKKFDWGGLSNRFLNITISAGGPSTSSSGILEVHYKKNTFGVILGTIDIPNWKRETLVGNFKTEEEAFVATLDRINQAEKAVNEDLVKSNVI